MQMSGVNGPAQFAGVQSTALYSPPFSLSTTVTGLAERGIPFEVYLISPDLRQFLSVAGHLGGAGAPRESLGIRTPFGGAKDSRWVAVQVPRLWCLRANWTGSGQPVSALGNRIYPAPIPNLPYTIHVDRRRRRHGGSVVAGSNIGVVARGS